MIVIYPLRHLQCHFFTVVWHWRCILPLNSTTPRTLGLGEERHLRQHAAEHHSEYPGLTSLYLGPWEWWRRKHWVSLKCHVCWWCHESRQSVKSLSTVPVFLAIRFFAVVQSCVVGCFTLDFTLSQVFWSSVTKHLNICRIVHNQPYIQERWKKEEVKATKPNETLRIHARTANNDSLHIYSKFIMT